VTLKAETQEAQFFVLISIRTLVSFDRQLSNSARKLVRVGRVRHVPPKGWGTSAPQFLDPLLMPTPHGFTWNYVCGRVVF